MFKLSNQLKLAGTIVLGVALAPMAALSETATATLTLEATVVDSCGLNGSALGFGSYTSGQAENLDASGNITFTSCPAGTLTFELDGGQSGNASARSLSNGSGGSLGYQLYTDSARSDMWGSGGDANSMLLVVPGSGSISVYGRIPGGQTTAAGSYTDTVNITLTF